MHINRTCFHYFIIAPSGNKYTEDILNMIESHKDILVHSVRFYKRRKLIKMLALLTANIPSQTKTKILRDLKPGSLVAILGCRNREDDYFGEGKFRHKENIQVRQLMHKIRDKYDSKLNRYSIVKNSKKHSVYTSANELETDALLKYMGYTMGIRKFMPMLGLQFLIIGRESKKVIIKKVRLDEINARFFYKKGRGKAKMIERPVVESPHFQSLIKGTHHYGSYFGKIKYKLVKNKVDPSHIATLSKKLKYLSPPYESDYIVVRHKKDGSYVLSNGHHRSAILMYRGVKKVPMVVVYD